MYSGRPGASSVSSRVRVQQLAKAPVISIIDDDESVREATKSLIKSLGYSATTFSSAEEYLRSGDIWESSCVITDLHMPGMSGADLQARWIAKAPSTPFILLPPFFAKR